jgi:hypothetical protein
MKYRVRLDMSFETEAAALALMNFGKTLAAKAVSINESGGNSEISFCDMEICRHDEGLPCTKLDRIEVRKI